MPFREVSIVEQRREFIAFVRKVSSDGFINFKNKAWRLSKAFRGEHIALRPTTEDGRFDVHYCAHRIANLDLRQAASEACGLVDNAETRSPQGPQAQQQQQPILLDR